MSRRPAHTLEAVALAFRDGPRLVRVRAKTGSGFTGPSIDAGVQKAAPTFRPGFGFGNGDTPLTLCLPGPVHGLRWDDVCDSAECGGPALTPLVRR